MTTRRHNGFCIAQLVLVATALLVSACGGKPQPPPLATGRIMHAAATETSGLAASHRTTDLLWIHNDSAGQPVLYAIGTDGRLRGTVRIAGIKNNDWEDLASFNLDGQPWLLIADTGDNKGIRKNCALYVIAEPDPGALSPDHELAATVAWRLTVVFPDGPHDCEAVAVDPKEETVFLLTKRTQSPKLYSLPLRLPSNGSMPSANLLTHLNGIPQPNSEQKLLPFPTGRFRALPTAMDIAPDCQSAAVLTHGDVLFFRRRPGESWSEVFSRYPEVLAPHGLPQAEALCFSRDGRDLYVTGEQKSQLLLRYKVPAATSQ
jgi:hypothetical protein